MAKIDDQIAERRKEAVKKGFFYTGEKVAEKLGEFTGNSRHIYDDGSIRIDYEHYDQAWTGGDYNVEIFSGGVSVYKGRGNSDAGPGEKDIERYVPGEWEDTLKEIVQKMEKKKPIALKEEKQEIVKPAKPKISKKKLRQDWGL